MKRVGVFVDDTPQNIITHVVNYKLDLIQLHGNETPTLIKNLRSTIDPDIRPGIKFIKAISVTSAKDIERCKAYEDCADYFLFDTRCTTVGGSGKQFDWSVLDNYDGTRPFLLSGGIGPDDADRIKAISHKKLIGIDLNSRSETAPHERRDCTKGFFKPHFHTVRPISSHNLYSINLTITKKQ